MKRASQYAAADNFDPVRGGDGGGGKQLVTLLVCVGSRVVVWFEFVDDVGVQATNGMYVVSLDESLVCLGLAGVEPTARISTEA